MPSAELCHIQLTQATSTASWEAEPGNTQDAILLLKSISSLAIGKSNRALLSCFHIYKNTARDNKSLKISMKEDISHDKKNNISLSEIKGTPASHARFFRRLSRK